MVIAAATIAAVAVGSLVFVQSRDIAVVADLGRSVSGTAASSVSSAVRPASSKSVHTPTAHLKKGNWHVDLAARSSLGQSNGRADSAATVGSASTVAGKWTAVGNTPIGVAPVDSAGRVTSASVQGLTVGVRSQAAASKQGLSGVVLTLARDDGRTGKAPVAVRVPTSLLRQQFGADYAARVRWVQLDGARKYSATAATPVATTSTADNLVMTPMVSNRMVTLAATSSPVSTSGTGSFSASTLKEVGSWDVSAQTGDFSWQYPMTVPPAAAGPVPSIGLSYDSQSIDGETGSTNNQPSAIGDGWDLNGGGFIERQYVSCSQDDGASGAVKTSGDQCWKTDNATLSLGGHSSALVRDSATGDWKMQSDDGSRIEHLVGTAAGCSPNGTYDTDCWRVTTTDGTQYYFGKNQLPGWSTGKGTTNSAWTVPVFGNDTGEPCHASTFAASSCVQAWRWNLDYVVDVHANAEAFYYTAETNSYGKNGSGATAYVRGGQLDHVDYGLTSASVYAANAATGRVTFGYDAYGRCSDTTHANCTKETISAAATKPAKPASYPDVPWDQFCTTACTANAVPSFWTDGMLDTVTTAVKSGTAYATVDKWTLSHSFPSPGDGTTAALWLTQVQHTGYTGSTGVNEPAVKFSGVRMHNRVWAVDGLAPLDKLRVASITAETGAVTSINYSVQDCTAAEASAIEAAAATNSRRCYPQWWTPSITPAQEPKLDLFHKYVVTSVLDDPKTGGATDRPQQTSYVYTGTPAWKYNTATFMPDKRRTWSVFAGYDTVEVRDGDASDPKSVKTTAYTFYRGLNGDRAGTNGGVKSVNVSGTSSVTDDSWLAGQIRESVVRAGVGGPVVSDTVSTPWASGVEANDGVNAARRVGDGSTRMTEPTAAGTDRTSETNTTYNSDGLPSTVSRSASDAADTCTTTTYASANRTAWLIGLPAEQRVVNVGCGSEPTLPRDAISDVRTSYDSAAVGATPTKGDTTKVETVTSYSGSNPVWTTTATSAFDTVGRETSSTDELGRTTKTAYTPATGGPVTGVTTTNPKGWKASQTLDPARGVVLSETAVDGGVTSATYDPLGRRTAVWMPGRAKADYPSAPDTAYAYTESQTGPLAVATTTLNWGGTITRYDLYDGLGRVVQTQDPSSNSGSVITDTAYDEQGRTSLKNNSYWASGTKPSASLFVPVSQQQIQSSTEFEYDAVGRTTATVANSYGKEQYRTTNRYVGADEVDTTPPQGGTPNTTFTNSLGQKTLLRQYLAASPTGTHQDTRYTYDGRGDMASMTDPAGNRWTWTFDPVGNKTSATDPDTGTTTYTYDNAGNVLSSKDARGVVISDVYDVLDRKTAEYSGGTDGALLSSWTYDTVRTGALTASSSYVGSAPGAPGAAYTTAVTSYDTAGRPTEQTTTIPATASAFGGTTYSTKQTYNQDGSPSATTMPAVGGLAAERVTTTYDALGLPSSLSGTKSYAGVVYDGLNRVAQVNRDGTVANVSAYTRDAVTGNISGIEDRTGTGSSSVVQAKRTYNRNDAGVITSATTTGAAGSETQCYNYDALQELTEAWTPTSGACSSAPGTSLGGPAPYWSSYTYDTATGNRKTATHHATAGGTDQVTSYTYPGAGAPHPHAVQSTSTSTGDEDSSNAFTYDDDGNTTQSGETALAYDEHGRILSATVGPQRQSNVYDADGNLLLQTDPKNGATLYLGDTELHVDAGASTTTATRTYALAGVTVAERNTSTGTSTVSAIDTDIDGNADLATDVLTGAVARRWFDPFGNQRGGASNWISAHGFLDKATSSFSGLTQLGARAYDATLGRFLSADPVLNPDSPQQVNGYAYSGNNPLANADPTGLCPPSQCAIDGGSRPKPMPGPVPFPWKGATTAPSTHAHHATPVQPYGHGGSKSANYPSVKKQAQTWKAIRHWAPVILLTALDIALTAGVIACTVATAGICAVAGGGELEAAGLAADADAIGSTIAAESAEQTAAAEAERLTANRIPAGVRAAAEEADGVRFGKTDNQIFHAFRHTDKAGLDSEDVASAVRSKLNSAPFKEGQQTIEVRVGGKQVQASAFGRNGAYNVGRLVIKGDEG